MSAAPVHRFTDPQSAAVVRGEICNHGTQRIRERFSSFNPESLPPAEKLIYDHARALEDRAESVNIITLTGSLKDAGKLSEVGGAGEIAPGHDTDEVIWSAVRSLEKCRRDREAARIGNLLSQGALGVEDAQHQLSQLSVSLEGDDSCDEFSSEDLENYKAEEDPTGLLGIHGAWMRQGKCGLLFGPSGAGKSSLRTHAAVTWGLGKPWFGIESQRRLKSLIVQAENDLGDEAEMIQGVARAHGVSVGEALELVVIVEVSGLTGALFVAKLDRLIGRHKPDVVWVDPLFSFAGEDLSLQRPASQFLREYLDPVVKRHGVAAFLLHHQGKPPRGKGDQDQLDPHNTYFGSVELSAYPRAIMGLHKRSDGSFELFASKRGKRAGLRNLDGDLVERILLKHADVGIGWDQLPGEPEQPVEGEGKVKTSVQRMAEFVKYRQKSAPYSKELSAAAATEIANNMGIKTRQVRDYEHHLKQMLPYINSLSFK